MFGAVVGVEEPALYPEFGQSCAEQVESAAVYGLAAQYVVARAGYRECGKGGGGHPAGTADCGHGAVERGNLALKRRHRGVGKAGVEVPVAL